MIGALIGAGTSIIGGLIKSGRAKKEEARLKRQLDTFVRQEFANVADSLSVDTEGSKLAKELALTTESGLIEALRKGGSRALLGGIGGIQSGSNRIARQIKADVAKEQQSINKIKAEDQAKIRKLQEEREIADLAGIGSLKHSKTRQKFRIV